MVAPYSINIYGSNIPITSSVDSLVSLTSLNSTCTDLSSVNVSVWGYYQDYKEEGESIKGEGSVLIDNYYLRDSYSFPIEEVTVANGLSSLSALYSILNKRYKFIEQVTSPYGTNIHETGDVIAVTCSGKKEKSNGFKGLTLEMNRRKVLPK